MNQYSHRGLRLAIFAIAALAARPVAAVAPANGRQPQKIVLRDFLYDVARRFDVYFTLETKQPTEGTFSPIEVVYLSPDDLEKISSVEGAIKTLRAKLNADVVPDEWNPAVIRVVEKPLAGTPGYALEQNLPLDYHGSLDRLVKTLEKRLQGSIKLKTMFTVPILTIGDPFTDADIAEKRIEVRRAMTDYVPLSAYNRILWKGETYFTNGKPTTIPEESYPALLALAGIGEPAVRAAETALASDTDPRRLGLLCRLVVGIEGTTKGKALVESAAARAEGAEHRGKIAAALAKALGPWQP